jgi:hypothetical protein
MNRSAKNDIRYPEKRLDDPVDGLNSKARPLALRDELRDLSDLLDKAV